MRRIVRYLVIALIIIAILLVAHEVNLVGQVVDMIKKMHGG